MPRLLVLACLVAITGCTRAPQRGDVYEDPMSRRRHPIEAVGDCRAVFMMQRDADAAREVTGGKQRHTRLMLPVAGTDCVAWGDSDEMIDWVEVERLEAFTARRWVRVN